jgi:hypothetical protein
MIDLDFIEEEQTLYCHLALAIWIDKKFSYYDWYALASGLDLYKSVEWEDQVASDRLVDALMAFYRNQNNPSWLYYVSTFIDCCKGNYDLVDQERIAELLLERVDARMAKSPKNVL